MIDRKEIDLLIRAQLKGGRDLESVTKSIVELEKAIERQAAAAKRGESSIDELRATLLALQQVQDRLKSQADLVGAFQRQAEAIGKTTERVSRATKAYEDYRTKLAGLNDVTDKQQDKLVRLSASHERAQATLVKQQERYSALAESLREAGIATDKLADAEMRVRETAAQIGVAINKTQSAISSYAEDVRKSRDALREKEKAEGEAIRNADLFAAAEKRASEAARKRAEDAAHVAQIISDRNSKLAADRNQFDDQAREAARARELAALRDDIIKRSEEQLRVEKELARNSALTKTADDAEKAARSYSSLARAADDLRPRTTSLREAISAITNPSAEATKSLGGIEESVGKLADRIRGIKGPVSDYRQMLNGLTEANRSIATNAGLVDSFRKQTDAARAARAELSAARGEVATYAAAVRQGGDSGAQFASKLAEASNRAKAAAQSLSENIAAARSTREALRAAGIETNNLSAAEGRLTAAARTSTTAIAALGAAVQQHGTETERTGRKLQFFNDGGRTTLSLMQRIRGEVLALAASYVGLQGAISLATKSLDAVNERAAIKSQISISTGNDKAAIDAEYEYVKAQSDRIGLEFDRAARGYAKFSAAAKLAGRDRQEIRYIWEAFAEVGRVANLSADDMDGVFRALEQITSKGKIQAEELRGQLGDRLFGAFQVAAQALKDQFPNLDKAMEKGMVTSDQLILIAQKYREIVGDQLPGATQSLAASQARLNTAIFDFKLALSDSGWTETYTNLIKEFSVFLRSDDGRKLAKDLGEGFSTVGKLLLWVLQNMDQVKTGAEVVGTALLAMVAVKTLRSIVQLGSDLKTLWVVLKEGGAAVEVFAAKWPILATVVKRAFGIMSAAMLGWEVGKWANEEFEVVRKAGVALVIGLETNFTRIKYAAQILWEEFPRYAKNAYAAALNTVTWGTRQMLEIMQAGLKALGKDDLASSLGQVIDKLTAKYEQQGDRVGEIRDQMDKDIKAIQDIGMEMWKDAERKSGPAAKPAAAAAPAVISPTPFPGRTSTAAGGPSDAEIAKREREIEAIRHSLETLDAKIDRSQTDTLSKQLEAVDLEYAKLARRIGAVGGEVGAEFMKHLQESSAQLKTQISAKFNQKLLDDQEALQNKLEDIEAAAGKRAKFDLEARLAGVAKQYEDTYRKIAEYRAKLETNGMDTAPADQAKARLDAGIVQLQNIERVKYATEELNHLEGITNDLISTRDKLMQAVIAQKEAGAITDEEAATRLNQIQAEAIPGIQAAAMATEQWALAHATIFANPQQMDVFIAQLEAVRAKATQAKTEFGDFQKYVGGKGSAAISQGLDGIFNGLMDIATGQKSVKQGFRDIAASTLGIFANFMRDIALAIIKLMIFRALANSGNPYLAPIGQAGMQSMGNMSFGLKHTGGVVGQVSNRRRSVPVEWLANAPRYHTGGIAGLAPDEYATILKKNEEVLTADSPRNILNGGANLGKGEEARPQDVSITNYVDAQSFLSAAAATPSGRKVIMNVLSAERAQLRTLVGR